MAFDRDDFSTSRHSSSKVRTKMLCLYESDSTENLLDANKCSLVSRCVDWTLFVETGYAQHVFDRLDKSCGAQAAWPAMFVLILFPTTHVSHLLDFYYFGSSDTIGTATFLVDLHTKASLTMALWIAVHTILLSIVYFIRDIIDTPYKCYHSLCICQRVLLTFLVGWVVSCFCSYGHLLVHRSTKSGTMLYSYHCTPSLRLLSSWHVICMITIHFYLHGLE